jgi:hypothetical protein
MHAMVRGAVLALAFLAVPATAAQWVVLGSGTAFQTPTNPPGTTRLEVPQLNGAPVQFGMLLDLNVPLIVNPGPGGFGEFATYQGAVQILALQVGDFGFSPAFPLPPLSLTVINDSRAPTGVRQDQVSVNRASSFGPDGVIPPLGSDPALDSDLFLSTFFFGRSATGTDEALPALVTSVFDPDLGAIWQFGLTNLSLQFRQGNPGNPAELAALPVAFFSVPLDNLFVFRLDDGVGIIPEPATWAMLIAGFGVVGGALRRRRSAPA